MKNLLLALIIAFTAHCSIAQPQKQLNILVFSKTNGYRHDAISEGIACMKKIAKENKWKMEFTEDSAYFTDNNLVKFDVIVFLLTTGDILNDVQQKSFEKFIQSGKGFVAVHTGTDTEYKWEWYGQLVGAYFIGHPPTQEVKLIIEDQTHPSTKHFGTKQMVWKDEFYSFNQNPRAEVKVLISIDESTFSISNEAFLKEENLKMGDHPLVWCREFDGGRSFHTGLGHIPKLYKNPLMINHLVGGIKWAAKQE